MKRKASLFLFVILGFLSAVSYGNPVDSKTAQQVASHFWTAMKGDVSAQWSDISAQNGFQEFYLFENEAGLGFVIVSADDCVQPILGYSMTNGVPSSIPVQIRSFLQRYEQEIQYFKAKGVVATEKITHEWNSLINGTYTPQNTTAVAPMLTTKWDQTPYYNQMCPDSAGWYALAGCVATATAQVMKYWEWPVMGVGSYSYTDDNFGPVSANFGATTYQWSLMPDSLDSYSSADQINAVATLIFHVGVAVKMNYGLNASSAYLNSSASNQQSSERALKNYFSYKNTLHCVYKSQTSDADWVSTLIGEINAGRPVLEAGSGEGGGHAFVCDGYDNNGLFHINWGWGSYLDGYFAHNALNPGDGGAGSNESNSYNESVRILVGIEPEGGNPNQQYTITVNSSNNAMGTVTGGGTYSGSSMVQLMATAKTGYRFTGWNDGETTNPRNIVVSDNITYTANFDDLGSNVRHYDNGTFANTWTVEDNQLFWGIRFPAGTLSPYTTLSAVRLWNLVAGNYEVRVYQGSSLNNGNMVASQNFQMQGSHSWHETNLNSPVSIDHSKILWVFVSYDGSAPAAAVSNYAGNTDGCWLFYGGTPYVTTSFNEYVTWMLRVVLDGGNDPVPNHTTSVEDIYSVGNSIVVKGAENTWVEIYDMTGRCILRDEKLESNRKVFNIAHSGVYVVRTGNGTTKKVAVVRP